MERFLNLLMLGITLVFLIWILAQAMEVGALHYIDSPYFLFR